jgi:hypothetical protein
LPRLVAASPRSPSRSPTPSRSPSAVPAATVTDAATAADAATVTDAATAADAATVTDAATIGEASRVDAGSPRYRSAATTREPPKETKLAVDESTNLDERRFVEVAPSRGDIERGADFGGAAGSDAIVMRAILAGSPCPFSDVEQHRASRAAQLVGERGVLLAEQLDRAAE